MRALFQNLFSTALASSLFISGCLQIEDGEQVITPSNIESPISAQTTNIVLLDGQSNALRRGMAEAITQELTKLTGRKTELIVCAQIAYPLQTHLLGGSNYKSCAIRRMITLSDPTRRVVGAILIQGESNVPDTPYVWSDLFKQYRDERREDLAYTSLPIVYTQLPEIVVPNSTAPDITQEELDQFRQNQQLLSDELYNDNVRMVTTEHLLLNDDGLHFTPLSVQDLSKLVSENLYELLLIQQGNGVEF